MCLGLPRAEDRRTHRAEKPVVPTTEDALGEWVAALRARRFDAAAPPAAPSAADLSRTGRRARSDFDGERSAACSRSGSALMHRPRTMGRVRRFACNAPPSSSPCRAFARPSRSPNAAARTNKAASAAEGAAAARRPLRRPRDRARRRRRRGPRLLRLQLRPARHRPRPRPRARRPLRRLAPLRVLPAIPAEFAGVTPRRRASAAEVVRTPFRRPRDAERPRRLLARRRPADRRAVAASMSAAAVATAERDRLRRPATGAARCQSTWAARGTPTRAARPAGRR